MKQSTSEHEYPKDEKDIVDWVRRFNERCEKAQEERRKQWEYLQSEEYRKELRKDVLASTHADIQPPWETDNESDG